MTANNMSLSHTKLIKETEMKKNKVVYTAYVFNEQGASTNAGRDTNLNKLKAHIRATYGPGWTAIISKIENDNGIMDFEPVEVARFTLRK